MWMQIVDQTLRGFIREGQFRLTDPNGRQYLYKGKDGPSTGITLSDPSLPRRIVTNPELALGEVYMDGTIIVDDDDLHSLFAVLLRNWKAGERGLLFDVDDLRRTLLRRITQANPLGRAQAHVAHHYDVSQDLYDLFLDADKQYSCAYFRSPEDSLETAQAQKKALIAAKLCLTPGLRVLDIGCGWGGLAMTLAREHGVHVTGITLSNDQHRVASARVRDAGLEDRVSIRLMDYREIGGQFDRIVSVGMFEHVGPPHCHEYFGKIREVLTDDGVALVHTIGRLATPANQSPWILKYIFPGGHVPAMTEVLPHIEKTGLIPTDIEVWRLHYAHTLRHWLTRFEAHKDKVLSLFDERFYRKWRYYLIASEMTFRDGYQAVFQFQLTRNLESVVPNTRDYLLATDPFAIAAQ